MRKKSLEEQLKEIEETTTIRGWDSFDAAPISPMVIKKAREIIPNLPPEADLIPTVRGTIECDWEQTIEIDSRGIVDAEPKLGGFVPHGFVV